jgi:hypothetical protein
LVLSAVAHDLQGRETTIKPSDVSPVISSQNLDSGNRNAGTTIVNLFASSSSTFSSVPLESDISAPGFEENNQILVSTLKGRSGQRKRSILQAAYLLLVKMVNPFLQKEERRTTMVILVLIMMILMLLLELT